MAGLGDRVLLAEALSDVGLYAECVLGRPLRSYQLPVARAICASVVGGLGLKLTVMLPRESGKNWISAPGEGGARAYLLLEIEEAQDVPEARYGKDFAPMGASTNATTVFYGTAWTADTLLARMKRVGLEEQARDGVRRHYQLNWRDVARANVG